MKVHLPTATSLVGILALAAIVILPCLSFEKERFGREDEEERDSFRSAVFANPYQEYAWPSAPHLSDDEKADIVSEARQPEPTDE